MAKQQTIFESQSFGQDPTWADLQYLKEVLGFPDDAKLIFRPVAEGKDKTRVHLSIVFTRVVEDDDASSL